MVLFKVLLTFMIILGFRRTCSTVADAAAVVAVVADTVSSVVGYVAVPKRRMTKPLVVANSAVVVVVSSIVAGSLIVVPSLLAQFSMPTDVNAARASLPRFAVVLVSSLPPDSTFPVVPSYLR